MQPPMQPPFTHGFFEFSPIWQKTAIRPQNLGQKTGLIGRTSGRATSLTLTINSGVDLEFRGLLGGPVSMVTRCRGCCTYRYQKAPETQTTGS